MKRERAGNPKSRAYRCGFHKPAVVLHLENNIATHFAINALSTNKLKFLILALIGISLLRTLV